MPFVLRQVTPVHLSRGCYSAEDDPRTSISNATLTACLKQLASLVALAADIFGTCQQEAALVGERTAALRSRLDRLQKCVDMVDCRTVPIPEGDLAAFSHDHKTNHFKSAVVQWASGTAVAAAPVATTDAGLSQVPVLNAVSKENRPSALQRLYDQAASPVCTPIIRSSSVTDEIDAADYGRLLALGATLRRRRRLRSNVLEIETRRPASLAHMREWLTDDEALDDLRTTVGPDNHRRIGLNGDSALHRLPSPEEKARVAASQVFTSQVVRLDVTGSGFERMTQFRRSLQHVEYDLSGSHHNSDAKSRHKRSSSSSKRKKGKKRRNTIACDGDRRDIHDALALTTTNNKSNLNKNDGEKSGSRSSLRQRLNLVHLLRATMTTPSSGVGGGGCGGTTTTSGGAVTSSDISYDESDQTLQSITTATDATSHASSELVVQVTSGHLVTATRTRSGAMMNTISRLRRLGTDHTFISGPVQVDVHRAEAAESSTAAEDKNGGSNNNDDHYELIPSEKEFGTLGTAKPVLRAAKLRGVAKDVNDGGRSSSGNWSASGGSSCSTRASMDSDRHPQHHFQHLPSPLAARHQTKVQCKKREERSLSPEDADSVLSGDDCSAATTTSTRDESHLAAGSDLDMETSSVYSCDAEGYYTSFQFDSGLKTLKEGQSDGSLHQNNRQSTSGVYDAKRNSGITNGAIVENEYELFGRGSTTTTSSAGTVIFRPDAAGAQVNNGTGSNNRKKRNSQPPEPPPRNGSSNRNSTASTIASVDSTGTVKAEVEHRPQLTASESKEIADALDQLRNNRTETLTSNSKNEEQAEAQESGERIRAKTQIERIPAMCVVTPPPSDDESVRSGIVPGAGLAPAAPSVESHIQSVFLQHMASPGPTAPRINVAELPVTLPPEDTPIVIKAAVVKTPTDGLVALNHLPTDNGAEAANPPFSSTSSESSRSSSLERKRKGARVTLDADGKVVYSSDSLRRRKAQSQHSTFEPGQENRKTEPVVNSAFRPNPIGFAAPEPTNGVKANSSSSSSSSPAVKPLSPPPYRPAPSIVRTQPDGQQADCGHSSSSGTSAASSPITAQVSRSDSYRMANDEEDTATAAFQRNDSYRRAQVQTDSSRLGRLGQHQSSGFAVVNNQQPRIIRPIAANIPLGRPVAATATAGTGQFISGHLADNRPVRSPSNTNGWNKAQPMSYTIKSPMLVKQMSSPGFSHGGHHVNGGGSRPSSANGQNGSRPQRIATTQYLNGHQVYSRQISSPAMMTSSPVMPVTVTNPNLLGRRTYGGPRLMVNPKHLPSTKSNGSLNNSLNSSGSSIGLEVVSRKSNGPSITPIPPSPVVRPPISAQDRPSFYKDASVELPGYQSLSPPPRMSALPLAVPNEFRRNDVRYNSLPARFKPDRSAGVYRPDYTKWLPPSSRPGSSASKKDQESADDSPEEGGFLEFNNNNQTVPRRSPSSVSESPTPSMSSCSLDVSFTSSLNESLPGFSPSFPVPTEPGMVVHSIGLVKRTTISDFKRKLLRHGAPQQKKMSAVEQLQASKPASLRSPGESPVTKQPALENLIRRSVRVSYIASKLSQQRSHHKKTDVLSSTIAEGRSEEELAERSSAPTSPTEPSTSVRRQLSFHQPSPSEMGPQSPRSSGCSTPIETSL